MDQEDGAASLERLFRRTGQAVYAAKIEQREYLKAQAPAPCFREAMAMISAGLVDLYEWKQKYGGLPEPAISRQTTGHEFLDHNS